MNDPFRHLERLDREMGAIACHLTHMHFSHFGKPETWRPAINAYRCGDRFVICVDLAGADKSVLRLLATATRLVLRGTRPPPEPGCDEPVQVLAMEIDYGSFERVLDLPSEVDRDRITAEHHDGLLWIYLPVRAG